jgi:hypothetical protein
LARASWKREAAAHMVVIAKLEPSTMATIPRTPDALQTMRELTKNKGSKHDGFDPFSTLF